ncbi:amino acid transporter, partial [Francisella tularensis subsp. holarctica]|nr:amino acid transporter [Francisella tularensis subsp. holarctica]
GISSRTVRALGQKAGIMVAWLYWMNTISYYPAVLILLATNFAYFIGRPDLEYNNYYITIVVLVAFCFVTVIRFYVL